MTFRASSEGDLNHSGETEGTGIDVMSGHGETTLERQAEDRSSIY